MATLMNSHIVSNGEAILELVLVPFRALADKLTAIGTRSSRNFAVERLCEMSDAELASLGTNRETAIQRAMKVYY